jgi:spore cortex formation protein SpoVR/YcgB (stage V sporulation)
MSVKTYKELDPRQAPHASQVLSSEPRMRQLVRNLNIMLPRVREVGLRFGSRPCRTLFHIKSDQQVLDDLIYPCGTPISRNAWWYGKQAHQMKRQAQSYHVFEFATISDPAHVVLGETNDITMHILVIIHAWLGHVHGFTHNIWHNETEQTSCLQKFAQDEEFVRKLVEDPQYGWEKYEYYADAAHALELHSGPLPIDRSIPSDDELRDQLRNRLEELKSAHTLAMTEPDRLAVEADIRDVVKLLSCHPISPTDDLLGFLLDPANTNSLTDNERRIVEMTRFENRYVSQVLGRTKILHEGISHWLDRRIPMQPELELASLGYGVILDSGRYDTMHDSYPVYVYSDPYALGEAILDYVDEKHSKYLGKKTVSFTRLHCDESGDLHETDEVVETEVDDWDRSFFWDVINTYDDMRLFHTFLTEEFFEKLHKKTMAWVEKMVMTINKILKDRGWNEALIFEGERFPRTLEEFYEVIVIWLGQIQAGQWINWFGYGGPQFPVSQITLWQMLQIVQIIASYDEDKVEFLRQSLLHTSLQAVPNIKLVDTGRENRAGMWTLRHEYDPDFGPLKQGHARQTLRYYWRFSGPIRLLTMELLTDGYGRPWGPPRPYQYFTENGETVKERWLSA